MKKIMPIIREGTSCDYHRIILPFSYLDITQVTEYKDAEIIIFNRIPDFDADSFFDKQKKFGFKYIVDMDDYWKLHHSHYLSETFVRNGMTDKLERFIKNANAVTVTNEALYIKAKELNKNVYIIPNGLPFDHDQFMPNKTVSNKVRFIYTGGVSHKDDVLEFGSKAGNINIDFTLAGYQEDHKESHLILNNIPFNRIKLIENQPLDNYMNIYNDTDVSLVPLKKTLFNLCKSNLKVIEAGCKNIPVITSKILPYYNPIDYKFINYADNKHEWYSIIKYFSKNLNYIKDRGSALGEHVRKHYDLLKINELRKELYNTI